MDTFDRFITEPTAGLSAITGGVLFGFSILVMPGLRRVSPSSGIHAMQQINLVAPRSLLVLPLIGSTLGCIAIGAWALFGRHAPALGWSTLGAASGIGSFAVTAAINIPLNNSLAHLDPNAADSAHSWRAYATRWTAANHVRASLSLLSAGALLAATRVS